MVDEVYDQPYRDGVLRSVEDAVLKYADSHGWFHEPGWPGSHHLLDVVVSALLDAGCQITRNDGAALEVTRNMRNDWLVRWTTQVASRQGSSPAPLQPPV